MIMLGGRHPAGSVECVADGCEGGRPWLRAVVR